MSDSPERRPDVSVAGSGSEKSMSSAADLSLVPSFSFFGPKFKVGSADFDDGREDLNCLFPSLGERDDDDDDIRGTVEATLNGVLGEDGKSMGESIMLGKNESPTSGVRVSIVGVSIVNHSSALARRRPRPMVCVMVVRRRGSEGILPTLRRCRSRFISCSRAHSPLTTKMNRLVMA